MPELDPGNHLSYMLQWFAFGIMIIIAVGISARRERKAAAEAGPRSSGDSEYVVRSEEHTSELQSRFDLVCRLLLEKKKKQIQHFKDEQLTSQITKHNAQK